MSCSEIQKPNENHQSFGLYLLWQAVAIVEDPSRQVSQDSGGSIVNSTVDTNLSSEDSDRSSENAKSPVNGKSTSSKVKTFFSKHVANNSNELKKNFRFECRVCSEVTSSYGIEKKALEAMKLHILKDHFSENCPVEPTKRRQASRRKSKQISPEEVPIDEPVLNRFSSVLKDHDYTVKYSVDSQREIYTKPEHDQSSSIFDLMTVYHCPVISTPRYPEIYNIYPFEPADIVELPSSCDTKPDVQSSTSGISKKPAGSKLATPRSVLECVENRVTRNPSASSEQRDAAVPDNNLENVENVESMQIVTKEMLPLKKKKSRRVEKPPHICNICNAAFTAKTSLQNHHKSHMNIKSYRCDECGRRLTRKHSLKYHMMTHRDEHRFECKHCERVFRHPFHFKKHVCTPTGEDSYQCEICANTFKTEKSFKKHLKKEHES